MHEVCLLPPPENSSNVQVDDILRAAQWQGEKNPIVFGNNDGVFKSLKFDRLSVVRRNARSINAMLH